VKAALALGLALAAPLAASAQAPAQSPGAEAGLEWFHGEWAGTATIFGRPAKVSMSIAPALNSTATALIYRAEIEPSTTAPAFRFEGRGVYRIGKDGKAVGHWADSQGNFHPLHGRIAGRTFTVIWGEPRTELGRSTYTLGDDRMLRVTDASLAPDGTWRVFAELQMARQ
jgi:hypothetical protein